jgi:hypothetical protein
MPLFIQLYARSSMQSTFFLITQLDPQARCQGSTVVHSY